MQYRNPYTPQRVFQPVNETWAIACNGMDKSVNLGWLKTRIEYRLDLFPKTC